MTLKATSKAKAPVIEQGTYPARLVQIIDLGTQKRRPWKGVAKDPIHMIRTTYELTTEFMTNEDGEEDTSKPRWISEDFAFYGLSADRAKSTQRYLALDPSKSMEGDWEMLLGGAVALTVVHNPNKDDPSIVYANIGSTAPIMKGMDVAELVNDPSIFLFDNPDVEVFERFPEFVKDRIKEALNYPGSQLEGLLGQKTEPASANAGDGGGESNANPYG